MIRQTKYITATNKQSQSKLLFAQVKLLRKLSPKAKPIRTITPAIYFTCIPITIVILKKFNKIGPLYHLR